LGGKGGSEILRPHVKANSRHKHAGDVPSVPKILGAARHRQMIGFRVCKSREHRTNTTKINPWHRDSDINDYRQQQHIFEDADPGYPTYAANKNKSRDQSEADHHGRRAMDSTKARDLYDEPQSRELYLQIWHEKNDPYQRHESGQKLTAVPQFKKIGLRLQAVLSPQFPNRRKQVEGDHVH